MKNRGLGRSERHPFHPSPSLLAFTLCIWLLMIFSQRAAPLSDLEAPPQSPSSRFMYSGAKGLPRMTFLSRQLTFSVCLPGAGGGRGAGWRWWRLSHFQSSLQSDDNLFQILLQEALLFGAGSPVASVSPHPAGLFLQNSPNRCKLMTLRELSEGHSS